MKLYLPNPNPPSYNITTPYIHACDEIPMRLYEFGKDIRLSEVGSAKEAWMHVDTSIPARKDMRSFVAQDFIEINYDGLSKLERVLYGI